MKVDYFKAGEGNLRFSSCCWTGVGVSTSGRQKVPDLHKEQGTAQYKSTSSAYWRLKVKFLFKQKIASDVKDEITQSQPYWGRWINLTWYKVASYLPKNFLKKNKMLTSKFLNTITFSSNKFDSTNLWLQTHFAIELCVYYNGQILLNPVVLPT